MKKQLGASLLAAACIFGLTTATPAEAGHTKGKVKILAVGDSKTRQGLWQKKLSGMLSNRNIPHVIKTHAVDGTLCEHWVPRIDNLLARHNPDLVIISCGTNDVRNNGATVKQSMHKMITASRRSGAHVVSAYINYSDYSRTYSVLRREPYINQLLGQEFSHHKSVRIADLRWMPRSECYLSDGLHYGPCGGKYVGNKFYIAASGMMGWPKKR